MTDLMNLDYVMKEGELGALVLKMNRPSDEGTMVWQCPGICRKVQSTSMILPMLQFRY